MTRVLIVVMTLVMAPAAQAFDPVFEAQNFAKINERALTDYTPEFNVLLAEQGLINQAQSAEILATDGPLRQYGRNFAGNLCANPMNGCAGDVRLYGWGEKGHGIVEPVLFTARNGSTLSGHVWRTAAGPAKKPGVVITNGSVQAPETLYWFAAQTLAKAGFVVLTWDPQGQGRSDTFGEGADQQDGFPSQTGRPFYDGTEDALDFFFSTPAKPYVARPSCTSGTSHAEKQAARVADGRSSAYNPFHGFLDTERVGLVGQSLGAGAVSYIGQLDPRVKTIIAYDNLRDVTAPGGAQECASGSSERPETLPVTKPVLGMSADYGLLPQPFTADPDPLGKSAGSLAAKDVDTGQLNIRGGTHYEFAYIPNPAFGATARGIDLTAWYTVAWMDHHLRADPTAKARLLTTRWREDAPDAQGDGNLFSTYFKSRLVLGDFACEDLREGCAGQGPDGLPPAYSFLAATQTPDTPPPPGTNPGTTAPAGADNVPPAATGPQAVQTVTEAGGCDPRSRITKVVRRGRILRISGRARSAAACTTDVTRVSVGFTRKGRTRYVPAKGTSRWRLRWRVKPGTYRLRSRARARKVFETPRGGRVVRIKKRSPRGR